MSGSGYSLIQCLRLFEALAWDWQGILMVCTSTVFPVMVILSCGVGVVGFCLSGFSHSDALAKVGFGHISVSMVMADLAVLCVPFGWLHCLRL